MFLPIVKRLRTDARLSLSFTGDYFGVKRPRRLYRLFGMHKERIINAHLVRWRRFDMYLSPDIKLAAPNARHRVHLYHGISFKGRPYTKKILGFSSLFMIGEDMLNRYLRREVLQSDDKRIEKIGMPKTDPLVDGSLDAGEIRTRLGIEKEQPVILYAPTWRPESSAYTMSDDIVDVLSKHNVAVLIKLHDHVFNPRDKRVVWNEKIAEFEQHPNVTVIRDFDIIPYMYISNVLISDASSVANEFTLLDRPILFMDVPELFKVYEKTIDLDKGWGRKTGTVVNGIDELEPALEDALNHPERLSNIRREAAADFFYNPGTATDAAVNKIYDLLELEPPGEQQYRK